MSLPLWECGLKSLSFSVLLCRHRVTPFMGVWIEILISVGIVAENGKSLPLWECGLKFDYLEKMPQVKWSLPLWECGLKYKSKST